MADLRLDLDGLEEGARSIGAVQRQFESSARFVDLIADQVGHDRLGAKVREFSSSWQITRTDVSETLEVVAGAFEQVRNAFVETDRDLQQALLEAGS